MSKPIVHLVELVTFYSYLQLIVMLEDPIQTKVRFQTFVALNSKGRLDSVIFFWLCGISV